jgi:hypothetical protein
MTSRRPGDGDSGGHGPRRGATVSCRSLSTRWARRHWPRRIVIQHFNAHCAARRSGLTPPLLASRFVEGTELLDDGTVLHLARVATVRFADASLALFLEGQDNPDFEALKAEFADVLGGPPHGLPEDQGIQLVHETGNRTMQRTRPL